MYALALEISHKETSAYLDVHVCSIVSEKARRDQRLLLWVRYGARFGPGKYAVLSPLERLFR